MVIAHLFTTEKMDTRKWIAFALGIVAAVFMISPWSVQEGNTVSGMIIMIFAAVTFAAYSVMGKRSIGRIGTYTQTSISFIVGSLILLAVTAAIGRPVTEGIAENIAVVLYCGIVVTGIGYLFYFLAIRYSDASTGSITFFIKPAIAPVFAVLILLETVKWNTIVGIILLVTASVITVTDTVLKRKEVEPAGENA
jgi:drug/metabolite transporter (DMT)-like permease